MTEIQDSKYLYGFAVHSIQGYIFATNKLKEIGGGSEIVEQLCTTFFEEQVEKLTKKKIEEANQTLGAAGNVRYTFNKLEDVQVFYREFPTQVKQFAGDITFSQAVVEYKGDLMDTKLEELNTKLEIRRNYPHIQPETGAMSIPIERRTGEPVYRIEHKFINKEGEEIFVYQDKRTNVKLDKVGIKDNVIKQTALSKKLTDALRDKMNETAKTKEKKILFSTLTSELTNEANKNMVALVHADGNGMGKMIEDIRTKFKDKTAEKLKAFSKAVSESTLAAFGEAFYQTILKPEIYVVSTIDATFIVPPIRPVIIGGDDVTFLIRADLAIDFTKIYLETFEKETKESFKKNGFTPPQKTEETENVKLTATAGIVFIKSTYPLHYAADLAESICGYAKRKSERKISNLQFYRVKDSFVNNYNNIVDLENKKGISGFVGKNYDKPSIENLQKKVKLMKKPGVPRTAIRELLSESYRNIPNAELMLKRMIQINENNEDFKEFGFTVTLNNNTFLYDLVMLDSLTNE